MDESPRSPTLFVDRNSGGRTFREEVLKAGIAVELHDAHFDRNTADHEWLQGISGKGWIAVTGDVRTQTNALFLQALSQSTAHVFLIPQLNKPEFRKADCLIRAYPAICRAVSHAHPPAMFIMTDNWKTREINFRSRLEKCRRHKLI